MMNVSICITTYNIVSYISQAIEGALMQKTSFPFEIVIGDDGSTDGTRDILLSYKEKYPDIVQLVLHDENIGVNRNDISVIERARGKYLAWCDGDDYWVDENKLQKQYEILENNPDVSLVHTDWIDYKEESRSYQEQKLIQNELEKNSFGKKCIEMLLLNQSSGCRYSSSMFRKKHFLKALELKPQLFLSNHKCNDSAVFIAMYEYGRFYHLANSSTVYRIRKESLSMSQNKEKRYQYLFGCFRLDAIVIDYYQLSDEVKNIKFKSSLDELLKYSFFEFKSDLAREVIFKAKSMGYQLSNIQKILYLASINKIVRKMLYPFLKIILIY